MLPLPIPDGEIVAGAKRWYGLAARSALAGAQLLTVDGDGGTEFILTRGAFTRRFAREQVDLLEAAVDALEAQA
jgi:hypothetical protein